jgi:hypothetical protein
MRPAPGWPKTGQSTDAEGDCSQLPVHRGQSAGELTLFGGWEAATMYGWLFPASSRGSGECVSGSGWRPGC